MYNTNDTIVAVSSGSAPAVKKIIRISGNKTFDILKSFVPKNFQKQRAIIHSPINIDELEIDCRFYLFISPNSYTGEDLAEMHIFTCDEAVELVFAKLLTLGCRDALAGEFTYRAYQNGKMDLFKAEAVAQLIQSSNQYQLGAAQRLFGGSVEQKVNQIRQEILELLSLIEAGLDFSAEGIEIIAPKKAVETAKKIRNSLDELLSGSITFEQITQSPSVVIAGTANAGKSSLVNALIGKQRSIVSDQNGTTRDVLEHWLKLDNCDCVLFDCAGLIAAPADILQTLANTAALRAIEEAVIIIFCADITKQDYSKDLDMLKRISEKPAIYTVSKCDLLNDNETAKKQEKLKQLFGNDFLATSAKNKIGLEKLKALIERNIIARTFGTSEAAEKIALTERHKKAVTEAIKNIENACEELEKGSEEITAMFLRSAIGNLSSFEAEHIDEQILDTVFSHFCIGK
ncbi:MAG: 50S ribosome-binding GTPase [Phycisphaerae bacterium]|nr:50S ribosome-binding GTPase [Phycisphaerae bacterium]